MRHFPFSIGAGLVLLACSPDEQTGPERSTSPDLTLSTAQYVTVDLGTLGGTSSEAYAINPAGQVVGGSPTSARTPDRAFLWMNGQMRNIGKDIGGSGSVAIDINEIGQVAGTFTRTDGTTRGFVWQNGAVKRIGTLGGQNTRVSGINRNGQVTGYSQTGTGELHPFLWQNGVMKDLAQAVGTQPWTPFGISNQTHIVGANAVRPVLWKSGTARTLNTPNGGAAFAVNNNGHAVGYAWTLEDEPNVHAALWKDGVFTDLGTLGGETSIANDISDVGLVVGSAERVAGRPTRPFAWKNGTMTELPTLGGGAGRANGTNRGKIVGASLTASGQLHATMWLPPS